MHELEQEVWIQLGIEDRIDKISDIISSTFNSSNGYYLSGLYYMRKAQEVQDFSQRDSLLKNAFSKTSKALKKFPNDTKCMELRCKIYRQYSNFNSKDYYSMLSAWYKNSSKDNVNMMYEYGRMAFCEGDYSVSIDIFAELEYELGVGNNLRSKQKDTIVDENGRPKKYIGKITELYSKKEGFISPISFISQYKFKFHPIAAAYSVKRGDDVKFEIAFNLRGPIAINVTKA